MMTTIFDLSGLLVLPIWALLIFAPRWRWTERIACSPWIVAGPAAVYAALVAPRMIELWPALASPTLPGIAALLGTPEGATIAWLHFLAFDLFVGRWVYLDAREHGMSVGLVSPTLVLVLMFGPFGFLLYLAVRTVWGRLRRDRTGAEEEANGEREVPASPLRRALAGEHRALALLVIAMVALLAVCLVGLAVDDRTVTGVSVWLKPAKFAASIAIYGATLVWLLGHIHSFPRAARVVSNLTALGLAVEIVVIVLQAARGTTSHFNVATPLDGTLFSVMGAFIALIWSMNLAAAALALRERFEDRALGWSLRLGLLIALTGAASGALMVAPTPEQRARMESGDRPTLVGAHTVGAPDGGPGLPGVGWSTEGGDHRVAHFVALHGLQAMPLLGWLLRRRRLRLGESQRVGLLAAGASGYLGLVGLLTWQALRGQPVLAPDGATLAVLAALVMAVSTAAGVIVARAPRCSPFAAMRRFQ